jgi:hypothetical protein
MAARPALSALVPDGEPEVPEDCDGAGPAVWRLLRDDFETGAQRIFELVVHQDR